MCKKLCKKDRFNLFFASSDYQFVSSCLTSRCFRKRTSEIEVYPQTNQTYFPNQVYQYNPFGESQVNNQIYDSNHNWNQQYYSNNMIDQNFKRYEQPMYSKEPVLRQPVQRNRIYGVSQSMVDPSFQMGFEMDQVPPVYFNQMPPQRFSNANPPADEEYYENSTLNQSMDLMKMASMHNIPPQAPQYAYNMNYAPNYDYQNYTQIDPQAMAFRNVRQSMDISSQGLQMGEDFPKRNSDLQVNQLVNFSSQNSQRAQSSENPFEDTNMDKGNKVNPEIELNENVSLVQDQKAFEIIKINPPLEDVPFR
jgi:hypothetical protein